MNLDTNQIVASRQTDALIAEKVFGWEIEWIGGEPNRHWRPDDGRTGRWNDLLPKYSTDIAAAWQIVEQITKVPKTNAEAKFAANTKLYFWFEKSAAGLCFCSSSEVALEICCAALGIFADN